MLLPLPPTTPTNVVSLERGTMNKLSFLIKAWMSGSAETVSILSLLACFCQNGLVVVDTAKYVDVSCGRTTW